MSLSHPDGLAQMMSGKSEITAHFTSAPFQYQELADKRVHSVLNSYDVLGGPHTFNVVWATTKLYEGEPKVVKAFLAALDEAMKEIKDDPAAAAALWVKADRSKLPVEEAREDHPRQGKQVDHDAGEDDGLRRLHGAREDGSGEADELERHVHRRRPQPAGKLRQDVTRTTRMTAACSR